jgi:predicted alpha/beta hydrolase family esterase
MKTAIIIHGMPPEDGYIKKDGSINLASEYSWLPWIKKELLKANILAETPEMPRPYLPNYQAWKKEFERFNINENTILVGHSCGAGFILRWLSENNVKVNKVALVAPWINPENDPLGIEMFEGMILDKDLLQKVEDLRVFISKDDEEWVLMSIKVLEESISDIKEKISWFEDKGHFELSSMGTREFPELLDFVLN